MCPKLLCLSFPEWLYKPYLTLEGPATDGVLHPYGVAFAYQAMDSGQDLPNVQSTLMPSFRDEIDTLSARRLGVDLATLREDRWVSNLRWRALHEQVLRAASLAPGSLALLTKTLSKLCLYEEVLAVTANLACLGQSDEVSATIRLSRLLAQFVLHLEGRGHYEISDLWGLATELSPGSPVKVDAIYALTVQYAKYSKNRDVVARLCVMHAEAIERANTLNDFQRTFFMSRYHRVAAFDPQMRDERDEVRCHMDRAEEFARSLPVGSPRDEILAKEVLYAVLESRTKEAVWLGDSELAELRATQLTEMVPCDPRPYLHLGEILAGAGKMDKALRAYTNAAVYAPPGAEIAWFMQGQCCEALGDVEGAIRNYLQSLSVDPGGISAVESLDILLARLGNRPLRRWCSDALGELRAREAERNASFEGLGPTLGAILATPCQ